MNNKIQKKKEEEIPKEFKRLPNWRELLKSEEEEENEKLRLERKQLNMPKQPKTHTSRSQMGREKYSQG